MDIKPISKYSTRPGVCLRCGRKGHVAFNCYAMTDIDGNTIEDDGPDVVADAEDAASAADDEELSTSCARCGRTGHTRSTCRAKTNLFGKKLT